MMISTKGRYALRIMSYLAEHDDCGPVSLKDISQNENIGIKYLEIIVSSLTKAGLLESVRGKNGGYQLNRKVEDYSLYDILSASEDTLAPVACVDKRECESADSCKTFRVWKELDDTIEEFLKGKTLKDIL
ncbi:MAG: Rrf2 family transcriptional regulator [Eubacterium sp.]|nr:Rrf2 family transcriptional regulator [Eubacterium sp.]